MNNNSLFDIKARLYDSEMKLLRSFRNFESVCRRKHSTQEMREAEVAIVFACKEVDETRQLMRDFAALEQELLDSKEIELVT